MGPRALLALLALAGLPPVIAAEAVVSRYPEGLVHGFLILHTRDGQVLADGDLFQTAKGDRVTSRLVFHFKDGSLHEETAVFSQRRVLRLLQSRLVQKGPAFPRALELSVDVASGRAVSRYTDGDGHEKVAEERLELPPDLSNGMILTLLKNVRPEAAPRSVALVVATPKPRLVTIEIQPAGDDHFAVGGTERSATHYVLKVHVGGLTGVLAALFGKTPPDSHVWILGGEAPAFVKSEHPFFLGAPPWVIELTSPRWPEPPAAIDPVRSRP